MNRPTDILAIALLLGLLLYFIVELATVAESAQ